MSTSFMHRTISFFLRSQSLIRSKVPTSLAIFIQTVYFVRGAVILGQYFGLAKLNSLSFIPLNLFECAYLVIFTNYVRAMTGCNQSYTVKREITFNHIITSMTSPMVPSPMVPSPIVPSADRPYKYDRFWSFE